MNDPFDSADVTKPSAPNKPAPDITELTGGLPARNYVVGGEVARGGMGAVLYAKDLNIRRSVAMKVVLRDREASPKSLLRFVEEAQVTGQLEHPGIVPIYDLGVDEQGRPFYTMKLVQGVTLKEVLDGLAAGRADVATQYPLGQLLTIFQKVCDAVAFAHSKGVVHRDLKPENIMIGEFGEVLVMDWGLAKILTPTGTDQQEGQWVVQSARVADSDAYRTLDGTIMGSPHFMAPEQAEGRLDQIDERTDVFALGAILYNILALQAPFAGTTVQEILANVRRGEIRPVPETAVLPHLPGGEVPESLAAVTLKAMALTQADRYQSAKELQADIAAYQNGFATSAENAGAWRQFTLFVRRNKTVSIAVAIILLLSAGFTGKVITEGRRAERALRDLKATGPAHYAEAVALIKEGKFEEAQEKVTYAIALMPQEAKYHYLLGNIRQSLLRLADAGKAYAQALQCDPNHKLAQENLQLCEKLVHDNEGEAELSRASLGELQAAMQRQERVAEALHLAQRLSRNKQALYDTVTTALQKAGVKPAEVKVSENGEVDVHWSGATDKELQAVRSLPITSLGLSSTKITSLLAIQGMQLRKFGIGSSGNIKDFSALKGMPLESLYVNGTPFNDTTLLKGMPLKSLSAYYTGVQDLSPLAGMALEKLDLGRTKVQDLTPLKGMPLRELRIGGLRVRDLSPLKGAPLTYLEVNGTEVADISPLKGMPLRQLYIDHTLVRDVGLLAELTGLEEVTIPREAVGIDALRRLPKLKRIAFDLPAYSTYRLWDARSVPTNFWKAYDAKKRAQSLIVSPAADGSVTLYAEDAMITSDALLARQGAIGNWKDLRDNASWRIAVKKPGSYAVQATYACDPKDAGSEYTVTAGSQSVWGKVQPTRSSDDYQTVSVGTLKLEQAGTITVVVQPTKKPGNTVMNLRQLKLEPKNP